MQIQRLVQIRPFIGSQLREICEIFFQQNIYKSRSPIQELGQSREAAERAGCPGLQNNLIIKISVGYHITSMKKVHPVPPNNISVSQLSTNEVLDNSVLLLCRLCRKTQQSQCTSLDMVFPCSCSEPIHKCCISEEMKDAKKGKPHRVSKDLKEQRYNCKKCAQVIRYSTVESLKCRSCSEIASYRKQNCCMCTSLIVTFLIMVGMMVFLIVMKSMELSARSQVLFDSAVIGISIAIAVIFLFVAFFFITEVLIKTSVKVELLGKVELKRQARKNSISIEDIQ